MFEQKVTVTVLSIMTGVLWVAGVSLAVVQTITGLHVGDLGIVCVAAGATLTVRQFLLQDHRRNVAAFELGKESVRRIRP